MAEKYETVTALFRDRLTAEKAFNRLIDTGFGNDDLSILMSEATHGKELGLEGESKAPEGATIGAITGGVIGAVVAGIAAIGTVTVPGLGLIAAGWIVSALAGGGLGAAAGGIVGALIGLGIPEIEAKFYATELEKGGVLVGARSMSGDLIDRAKAVFKDLGGEKIHTA